MEWIYPRPHRARHRSSASACSSSAGAAPSGRSRLRRRRPAAPADRAPTAEPGARDRRSSSREVVEPEVVAPPTLRDRMARARSALAGAFVGIRGRRGITEETWDELEEALLLADVGIGVTTDLLDGLRTRVKDKELTEPDELIDALRTEMKGQLGGRRPGDCASSPASPAARTCGSSSASTASARRPRSARSPAPSRRLVTACCWPPGTRSVPPLPSS